MPSDPSDPANDVYYGPLPPPAALVMRNAIAALERAGAVIIRANMPTVGWMGGPGSDMPVLNLNPESATKNQPQRIPTVFVYELKNGLNAYLRDWATETPMKTMSDIVAFNKANAGRTLRFGQDIFLASEATRGDFREPEYAAARQMDIRTSRTLGLDAYMATHRLDAVLFPGQSRRGHRGQSGLSERSGAGRVRRGRQSQFHAGLSLRRHIHRARLERAGAAAACLRLRAGNDGAQDAARCHLRSIPRACGEHGAHLRIGLLRALLLLAACASDPPPAPGTTAADANYAERHPAHHQHPRDDQRAAL